MLAVPLGLWAHLLVEGMEALWFWFPTDSQSLCLLIPKVGVIQGC